MKTQPYEMFSAKCEDCGGEGPLHHSVFMAEKTARDLGWAEEKGVTRCPECRGAANLEALRKERERVARA